MDEELYRRSLELKIEELFIEATIDGVAYTVRVSAGSPLGQELLPHIQEEWRIRQVEDGRVR